MIRIGVDAMGGDFAPQNVVLGAIEAFAKLPGNVQLNLIGDKESITRICSEEGFDQGNFIITHTTETILNNDHPVNAYKQKTNSSIVVGFEKLKKGEIDAFASTGSTGAMMAGSMMTINTIKGILRPCISALLPMTDGGEVLLLDVGFNADCKKDLLYQFAILGTVYATTMMNISKPKVALLNIGEEGEKGNMLVRDAYKLFKNSRNFDFVGSIEGNQLTSGKADVVVTDGFTGNIVLKQAEGLFATLSSLNINNEYLDRFNYEIYGGTPVLGILAPVIIGHGISSPRAICNMILQAIKAVDNKLVERFKAILYNEPRPNPNQTKE